MILSEFTSTSKINLFLDIKGKDPSDSYHFLESIFVEIPWGDDFIVSAASEDIVIFSGLGAEHIPQENTVSKSLKLFKEKFSIGDCFRIEIKKNVPSGAGLGGGSGDAGAFLRFLCGRYRKKINDIRDIAVQVGSDVSFFLTGGSAHISGKGEKVTSILGRPAQGLGLLIVVPEIHISTKEAYSTLANNFKYSTENKLKLFLKNTVWGLDFLQENTYNIFEKILVGQEGLLNNVYHIMKQKAEPLHTVMSGSGSGFVFFYDSPQQAMLAETQLNKEKLRIYTQQIWL